MLCLVVYVLFLLVYFWSTPYYPTMSASDALHHAQVAQSVFAGQGRSVLLHTNAAVGLHFVAAVLMTLLQANSIQSLVILASLVLLAILVLFFLAAQAFFDDENLAALAALVGGLVLPADAMHFILVGTYPNLVDDAIVLVTVIVLFSYLRKPSVSLGMTLVLLGVAGVFMHSSFLLFLAILWLLLPALFMLFRGVVPRYFQACTYSTVGVLVAAFAALSFLRGSLDRVLGFYPITNYIGGASASQLLESIGVVYWTLAWNIGFFMKPVNVVAVILGFVLVAMRGRRSIGGIFVASWLGVLAIMSLLSGETDRFVLFCMVPSTFLVAYFVGSVRSFKAGRFIFNRRFLVSGVLLGLVIFGGFLPLLASAFNPARRLHEESVFASMEWLQQNPCPSAVASLGLESDFRFLPVLTSVQYAGSLPPTTTPAQVLNDSKAMGFACVAIQTENPNLPVFELTQVFHEEYRNPEIAILFIVD